MYKVRANQLRFWGTYDWTLERWITPNST